MMVNHALPKSGTNVVTHTIFKSKALEITEIEKLVPRSQVARIIDRDDELKNIAGKIPEATGSIKT